MKIGILSDTHNETGRTARAVRRLVDEGAEVLVHCGDLTRPHLLEECAELPTWFVFGNNDFDVAGLRGVAADQGAICLGRGGELELGGKRLAVTHGDSVSEMRRLTLAAPDYLLFGHSHVAADSRVGTVRMINPGALHRAKVWTVALLDLSTDTLVSFPIDAPA